MEYNKKTDEELICEMEMKQQANPSHVMICHAILQHRASLRNEESSLRNEDLAKSNVQLVESNIILAKKMYWLSIAVFVVSLISAVCTAINLYKIWS